MSHKDLDIASAILFFSARALIEYGLRVYDFKYYNLRAGRLFFIICYFQRVQLCGLDLRRNVIINFFFFFFKYRYIYFMKTIGIEFACWFGNDRETFDDSILRVCVVTRKIYVIKCYYLFWKIL